MRKHSIPVTPVLGMLTLAAILGAAPARAQTADVIHWWTSGSESKAVAVFADAFKRQGGTWVDDAVVGGPAARTAAMNRIAGGDPPTAMQWNVGVATRTLAEQGVLAPLDDIAAKGGWTRGLPPLIVQKITTDGHIYAVPVDIQGINLGFYSRKVFADLKLDPPKTWDDFFAAADTMKAAGIIPLAVGGQAWQEEVVWQSVVLGDAGPETFAKIFNDHDAATAAGDKMVHAFGVLRRITTYVDPGSPNRKWNDTALLVEQNKAAMQIMGDWTKGELLAAGLKIGQDFDVVPAPGTDGYLIIAVDVFAFPKIDKPGAAEARAKLATLMGDPAVQVAFNREKGAIPARLDAVMTPLDHCSTIESDTVRTHPDHLMPNIQLSFSPDTAGQIDDLITQFWNTPSMTPAQAAAALAKILASADG